MHILFWLPWWLSGKEYACNAGVLGLIPGSGSSLWRRKWQPILVFLLKNPMGRGSWWDTVYGVACNWATQHTHECPIYSSPGRVLIYYILFALTASLVAQRLKRLPPMRATGVLSLGWEDPLGKEIATHSSILAWRIPWLEEPSRLQTTGSQTVRHDWATSLSLSLALTLFFWAKNEKKKSHMDLPCGPVVKNLLANAGDMGFLSGPGRLHMLRGN